MSKYSRVQALERIRNNISKSGVHIYVVSGGGTPRYAYTIGLSPKIGAELILAGGYAMNADGVLAVVNQISRQLVAGTPVRESLYVEGYGFFTLRTCHDSWSSKMMLGAFDYYQDASISALQVCLPGYMSTLEVPNMQQRFSIDREPAWRWLFERWSLHVPEKSIAVTNMLALKGERITEAVRWEVDDWEMFVGPGATVAFDDARAVPLGLLLAIDPTLSPVMELKLGEGICRDADQGDWIPRGRTP
jgi:hypothetical protein